VRIAGEVFDPGNGVAAMLTSFATLAGVDPGLTPQRYDVGLKRDQPQAYANAARPRARPGLRRRLNGTDTVFMSLIGLVTALTLLLMIVAGLGVLNTVVLQIRERVHDLGVFKAVRHDAAADARHGGFVGHRDRPGRGLIAIRPGWPWHGYVLPVMATPRRPTCRLRC